MAPLLREEDSLGQQDNKHSKMDGAPLKGSIGNGKTKDEAVGEAAEKSVFWGGRPQLGEVWTVMDVDHSHKVRVWVRVEPKVSDETVYEKVEEPGLGPQCNEMWTVAYEDINRVCWRLERNVYIQLFAWSMDAPVVCRRVEPQVSELWEVARELKGARWWYQIGGNGNGFAEQRGVSSESLPERSVWRVVASERNGAWDMMEVCSGNRHVITIDNEFYGLLAFQ